MLSLRKVFAVQLGMAAQRSPTTASCSMSTASSRLWSHVPLGPVDAILGITEAFRADTHPKKINLGVGAYRTNDGKPYVLECIQKAEAMITQAKSDKEYTGIGGVPDFVTATGLLAFGRDSRALKEKSVATCQSISGTGALRLGGEFFSRHAPQESPRIIYLPSPTWGNHGAIFKECKLEVRTYRYFDRATNGLDYGGMVEDLEGAPSGSLVLLHACAHNPTGVDPTREQWTGIGDLLMRRGLVPFFDMAYQGFASGDPENDAWAVRHFISSGHLPMVAQSYAKNMGLYGERIGAISVCCADKAQRECVESQLKLVVRPMYSNPPIHGARLVANVLGSESLRALWLTEVKAMADRIIAMRHALRSELEALGSTLRWNHITDQIGMFCFTGLAGDQVQRLTDEFHIYLTKDGRISIAGINSSNVKYLAESIHSVSS